MAKKKTTTEFLELADVLVLIGACRSALRWLMFGAWRSSAQETFDAAVAANIEEHRGEVRWLSQQIARRGDSLYVNPERFSLCFAGNCPICPTSRHEPYRPGESSEEWEARVYSVDDLRAALLRAWNAATDDERFLATRRRNDIAREYIEEQETERKAREAYAARNPADVAREALVDGNWPPF